jgi:ribosome-binding protein aMBF1 (putative translation factor)
VETELPDRLMKTQQPSRHKKLPERNHFRRVFNIAKKSSFLRYRKQLRDARIAKGWKQKEFAQVFNLVLQKNQLFFEN